MDRSNTDTKPSDTDVNRHRPQSPTEPGGISPLNPSTFPRAEDDEETLARSSEFHDVPDPGPNVGRRK